MIPLGPAFAGTSGSAISLNSTCFSLHRSWKRAAGMAAPGVSERPR